MRLYDTKSAPNPRRVRVFLAEKGVEIPVVQVDLLTKENYTPEFRAKNPMGRVPVLELDDGTCIAETVAICRYVEGMRPQPPLMGTDAKDRALVEMWQRRIELEIFQPIANVFVHTHDYFKGRVEQVPAYGEACRKHALARMQWLDGELARRPYVAGERFTIADITALCGVDWGRVTSTRIPRECTNLLRWHELVSDRPSAKA
ncbi:MAG: glutathione S-transferase family protein [Candidatus Binatia bacterium]